MEIPARGPQVMSLKDRPRWPLVPQVIIIGAGILGLASAYHILKDQAGLDLLVVDKLAGPGRGDTAKSAAAFATCFLPP